VSAVLVQISTTILYRYRTVVLLVESAIAIKHYLVLNIIIQSIVCFLPEKKSRYYGTAPIMNSLSNLEIGMGFAAKKL
jgi:hypothetical protein